VKIKIINPDYGMKDEQIKQRVIILKNYARKDTVICMECLQKSEVVIDSLYDVALASKEIVEMAIHAEKEGYDAVILYCFSDPALDACREMLRIPVIGAGQASLWMAMGIGYSFSLITTEESRIPEKRNFVLSKGIANNYLASVRCCNLDYFEMEKDPEYTLSRLEETSRKCMEEDNAEVIILGCLSLLGMGQRLSKLIGIPVLDPAVNSVLVAECYVSQGITHSKKSYPYPQKYR